MPRLLLTLLLTPLVGLGLLTLTPVASTAAPTSALAASADDTHPEWGGTAAPNATIKRGCRQYEYTYAITPPDGDWALETFLVGPGGKASGSGYFLTGKDATHRHVVLAAVPAQRQGRPLHDQGQAQRPERRRAGRGLAPAVDVPPAEASLASSVVS